MSRKKHIWYDGEVDDFREYYDRCKELGNIYMYGGQVAGGATPVLYGLAEKRLTKNDQGDWGVSVGGIFPDFEKYPVLLGKDKFADEMRKLGVPENLLEDFFESTLDFANF